MQRAPGLYYASSARHGLGVFCAHPLSAGDIIEICPVLVLPVAELPAEDTMLYAYYFAWGASLEEAAIALGYGSLYNHGPYPNASFIPDERDAVIVFTALRDIEAGEEITVDYHEGLHKGRLWFSETSTN